jgi:hypothetical protein
MSRWLLLTIVILPAFVAAQGRIPPGMPADARKALDERLIVRGQETLQQLPLSESFKARIGRVRDKAVLNAIEADASPIRLFSAAPGMSTNALEERTSARLSLYELSTSTIPESTLQAVRPDLTKEGLAQAAAAPNVDLNLTRSLALAFPAHTAFRRGAIVQIFNPKTPVTDDNPPEGIGSSPTSPENFDEKKSRMRAPVWRMGFNRVGLLANVSATPFKAVCSGIVLNKQWFLTATHCFVDRSRGILFPATSLRVFLPFQDGTETVVGDKGHSANMLGIAVGTERRWYGEVSGRNFPSSEAEASHEIMLGNDVALLQLNIPDGAIKRQMRALAIPEAPNIRPPFTLAGYGRTNATERVGDQLLEVGVRMDVVAKDAIQLYAITGGPTDNGRICDGDSGGPVFLGDLNGSEPSPFQLIAIASALRPRSNGGSDACLNGEQLFTRLDTAAVRKWICATAGMPC